MQFTTCFTNLFVVVCQGDAIEVEEALKSLEVRAPSVVAFGATKDSPSDIKVIIENDNIHLW